MSAPAGPLGGGTGSRLAARLARLNSPLLAAALATALCALIYAGHAAGVTRVGTLDRAEAALLDARFKLRGPRRPIGDDLVIVALDDATRARAPEVFQTRAGWGRLIDALGGYAPLAIGVDALFASPEVILPDEVVARVRAARDALAAAPPGAETPATRAAEAALAAVIEETRGDELLAAAVARARVVHVGALFFLDDARDPAPPGAPEPPGLARARYAEAVAGPAPASRRPPVARRALWAALPPIARAARGAGFINAPVDGDGAVRRAYLAIEWGGRTYFPLGLALAQVKLGASLSYVAGDTEVQLGDRRLPVDRRAIAQLDFLGPSRTFSYVSAIDVIEGKAPRAALAGKLVLVAHADAARDRYATPFDPLTPGVEVHATLAHNVLHGELLRRGGPTATLAAILGLGAVLSLLQLRRVRARRAWLVVTIGAVALAGYLVAVQLLFARARLVLDVAAPLASFVVVALASLSAALVVEGREKARIKSAFSQYLDDRAIQQLLADPSRLRLGGDRRELTVLFSDIRGFSSFSERLEPQQLVSFLNEYLTPMTEIVLDSGGLLDKYIGDAVMAVYGAPLDQADHAARACRAALEMQRRLAALNVDWKARGLPRIAVGVGINTGVMSVGNLGSERRFNYTVVGDAVNLASRLEGLTKEYGAHILMGERTRELVGEAFDLRELDLVRVKGKARPGRVYELLGVTPAGDAPAEGAEGGRARFAAALDLYRRREWDSAEGAFAALVAEAPDDGPARTFLERVRRLRDQPLPEDWDGVYDQVAK